MFILDADGFKKVVIKPLPPVDQCFYEYYSGDVVYLYHGKNKTRLHTGFLTCKDAYPRCNVNGRHMDFKNVYGYIVSQELLKPSELNKFNGSP